MKKILLAFSFSVLAVSSSFAERVVLTFQNEQSSDPDIHFNYRDITLTEGQVIQFTWLVGNPGKMKALLGEYASGSFPVIDTAEKARDYNNENCTTGFFVGTAKGPCKVRITPGFTTENTYKLSPYGYNAWLPYRYVQFEGVCEYDITTTTTSSSSIQSISNAAVVVPSNAVGDVDVLLEQSTDMITWTQCLPGTYNASTQKRFFRVRAVEK